MPETEVLEEVLVTPFGIEIDHHRNDDILLQSIPGLRLRSAIDGTKGFIDENGDYRVPQDQSRALASFPKTPGQQLHINPRDLSYVVVDPLATNEELCSRVVRFLRERGGSRIEKIKGVPDQAGKLDVHRMKTLCREIIWLLQSGDAKIVKGAVPKIEDVADLPGEFLLNPGSQVHNSQPRFECDYAEWIQNLSRVGG